MVAVNLWILAIIALLIGFLPGATLFPWLASPFGPGLWILSEPFARIHLTISQFIRRDGGVLVKRESDDYEIGTYLPDAGEVVLSDTRLPVDPDDISWGLFGKRPFGMTWEPGTTLHKRITREADPDEGAGLPVNIGAAHRFVEGANDADVITRTENKAKAEYGGGNQGLSGLVMAVLVGAMLVMGSFTAWFMV